MGSESDQASTSNLQEFRRQKNMLCYTMWMQSTNARLWESTGQTTRFLQQIKYKGKKDEGGSCELRDLKACKQTSLECLGIHICKNSREKQGSDDH